jgi:hypothetical protein
MIVAICLMLALAVSAQEGNRESSPDQTVTTPPPAAATPSTRPYLGQQPPGSTPLLFAPGIISTENHEFSCCFSPDGNEIYFTRRVPELDRNRVMVVRQTADGWTSPEIAPKAGEHEGMEPYVSPDGNKLFFQTWRPVPGATDPSMDIWMCERSSAGWNDPIHLEHPFNPGKAMFISIADNGTIYTTDITAGMGTGKIVTTRFVDGRYEDFVALPATINATSGETYPCVAPDESFLLFTRVNPDRSAGLFISRRKPDGNWGEAKQLDFGLQNVLMARLSPDGRYLFFTSTTPATRGDIYWVDASVLEAAK